MNKILWSSVFIIVFATSLAAKDPDESALFGKDTMIKTNKKAFLTDPNKGTGRKFQIGGDIFLNTSLALAEVAGGSFSEQLEQQPFTFSSDLIVYLDARLNSHLRVFTRVQTKYTGSNSTNDFILSEAFVDFDFSNKLFFRIGRQKIKTGLGNSWRVSDWLNTKKIGVLDSDFSEKTRTGLTGIKMTHEGFLGNKVLFLKMPDDDVLNDMGFYFRFEWQLGSAEISLASYNQRGTKSLWSLGANVGFLGLDWHGEIALSPESGFDKVRLVPIASRTTNLFTNIEVYRDQKIRPQVVIGASYNNQARKYSIGFEYFYNDAGYDNKDLYAYALLKNTFTPNYMGKHYLSLSLSFSEVFALVDNFSLVVAGNLSDTSFSIYPYYTTKINDELTFSASCTVNFGSENGEYTFPRINVTETGVTGFAVYNPFTMEVVNYGNPDILKINLRLSLSF